MYDKIEHRQTFGGILYRLRKGIAWRDFPKEFSHWSTVFRRFHLWPKKGILTYLFKVLANLADMESVFTDGSIGLCILNRLN